MPGRFFYLRNIRTFVAPGIIRPGFCNMDKLMYIGFGVAACIVGVWGWVIYTNWQRKRSANPADHDEF